MKTWTMNVQSHPLQRMAISWPQSTKHLNNECAECSPLTNAHFKTIFWVQLYLFKQLCHLGYLNNEWAESSLPMDIHFKTIFLVKLYWLKNLCVLEDLNNENADFLPLCQQWVEILTIFRVQCYQIIKLSVLGDLNNIHAVSFQCHWWLIILWPSSEYNLAISKLFSCKTLLTQRTLCLRRLE